jgi:hypothetical protein
MKFAQAVFFIAARHDDRKKHPSQAWHPVVNFHDFDSLPDVGSNSIRHPYSASLG